MNFNCFQLIRPYPRDLVHPPWFRLQESNHISGVCILHGDSHMLAADDGTFSDYATGGGAPIPVMCAAPLDQNPSLKGGPYSQGVYRVRERSGFDFGINQIVEVLTGAATDSVRKWKHETLSTYGIGKEHNRNEWKVIGRELVRLGYLRQVAEKFNVLQLTEQGLALLKQRQPVMLTKPAAAAKLTQRRAGEIGCDEVLFERLRQLRKVLADELSVPSYIVFSDVALRQMARYYPTSAQEFARISGVGERKLAQFGEAFLAEIAGHLHSNPRQIFADDSFATPAAQRRGRWE